MELLEQRRVLATFFVSNLADAGAGSLREAISMSDLNPGDDTVEFNAGVAGTIFITSELEINDGVTINGPGAEIVTIDAQQNSRVIREGSDQPVTIRGLTITGGRTVNGGDNGGGILTLLGEFTLESSVLTGNATLGGGSAGGGIAALGGDITIRDTVISENYTSGSFAAAGAASFFYSYEVNFINCTISQNHTSGPDSPGGAIFGNISVRLTESTVTGNSTRGQNSPGGAVFIDGNEFFPTLRVVDSTISENWTQAPASPGGAVLGSIGSIVQITRSSVDGNRTEQDDSPGGAIAMGMDAVLTITESTVSENYTRGISSSGGGIYVESDAGLDTDTLITASVLSHNHTEGSSSPGGAIHTSGFYAELSVVDSVISHNQTQGLMSQGGAVAMNATQTLEVADSTFTDNATLAANSRGGAMYLFYTYAMIERANISGNYTIGANSHGGAIAATFGSVTDSTISGNQTSGDDADGGAIHALAGFDIVRSAIVLNAATGTGADGGGIAAANPYGVTRLLNSTISGNSASQSGGGLSLGAAYRIEIEHSTITENTAPTSQGAGIAYGSLDATVVIANSIISANVGTDVDSFGVANASVITSGGFNIVGSGDAVSNFSNNDQTGQSPFLGPLQSNGGFAPSHLPMPGSPAIDMGDPAVIDPPSSDQRGFPFERIFSALGTPRLDVGAIEVQPLPGDFDLDGDYDCVDIDALVAAIVAGVDPSFDLNQDSMIDLADQDLWLQLAGYYNVGSGRAYLLGDATLDGIVDGLDFIAWNDNKFAMTPAVPGWCDGNFNADPVVDGLDFILWNENKFQGILPPSAAVAGGVPDSSSVSSEVPLQARTSEPNSAPRNDAVAHRVTRPPSSSATAEHVASWRFRPFELMGTLEFEGALSRRF